MGQNPKQLYSAQQLAAQRRNADDIGKTEQKSLSRALRLATEKGWKVRETNSTGAVMLLVGVDENDHPLYNTTYTNRAAAFTTRTLALQSGGSLGLNLTGGSEFMKNRLGIWDGGRVLNTHNELTGRVVQQDNATTTDNHATHVAGTMIAAGLNPQARGMASGAFMQAFDFGNDTPEMSTASSDLLISNHSYGTVSGWRFNDARPGTNNNLKWEWYGDSTVNEMNDFKFGIYNSQAREYDRIAYAAPSYLIVKSAGNDRGSNGPPAGTAYFIGSSARTSTKARAPQNDYDLISTYGTAKNILTVGAISPLTVEYNKPSDPQLSSFSSWGPTDDGRIKPDLVADGVNVLSTSSSNANAYATLSGTSMSSPNVSGTLFLLQELYAQRNGQRFARASTIKGLVLHTADEAGTSAGPDYRFGWGLLNAERAARAIVNADQSFLIAERTLLPNETQTVQVVASGRGGLAATICWNDPESPATAATAANFNDRTPKLINDLDVRISDGTNESLPWVLNPEQPATAATRADNIRDNVEQVVIADAVPGRSYTITIRHKGTLTNNSQAYALIVSGIGGKAYCESRATSDADTKITRVVLGNIQQNALSGCQRFTDFTATPTLNVASGQVLPLEVSVGTCGADLSKAVRVFVDWNADGDFDDANETAARSGVLSGNAVFQASVRAPAGLAVGNVARVRVVCVETTDSAAVAACGTYPKGETQEFRVAFVRPDRDVSARAIVAPETGFCANTGAVRVSVLLRNTGLQTQSNIPVTVRIFDATNQLISTLNTNYAPALASFAEGTATLSEDFGARLVPGASYSFVATTSLPNDQDVSNNEARQSITAASLTPDPVATATYCGTDPVSLISRNAVGTAFWYDSPTAQTPVAVGSPASLAAQNQVFYVGINQFNQSVGPATKGAFTGGSYSGNFGPSPIISTRTPLVLESARLYTATAGRLTFTVLGLDDRYITATTVEVRATRGANAPNVGAPAGQVADDPNDPGEVYALNLPIPEAGDYKITIGYENGATIFRSNAGVTGFPFVLPNILSLRGALFNRTATQVDTLTNAYYYFYDLKVRSLGCPTRRVAVAATTAEKTAVTLSPTTNTTVCEGGALLLTGATAGASPFYEWLRNGQVIANENRATFSATSTGLYQVRATPNGCLPTLSPGVTVTSRTAERPTVTLNALTLTSVAAQSYQWFLDSRLIPNATRQSFEAIQTGNYSVRANVNGCGELLSADTFVLITSLAARPDAHMRLYPNPTTDGVQVEYAAQNPDATLTVSIYDLSGRKVYEEVMKKSDNFYSTYFDAHRLNNGTFFAAITNEKAQIIAVRSFVKN